MGQIKAGVQKNKTESKSVLPRANIECTEALKGYCVL